MITKKEAEQFLVSLSEEAIARQLGTNGRYGGEPSAPDCGKRTPRKPTLEEMDESQT